MQMEIEVDSRGLFPPSSPSERHFTHTHIQLYLSSCYRCYPLGKLLLVGSRLSLCLRSNVDREV